VTLARIAAALLAAALLTACGDDDDDDERVSASAPDFSVELPDGWEEQDAGTREAIGEQGIENLGEQGGLPENAQFAVDVQAVWSVTEPSEEFTTNVNVFAEGVAPLTPARYLRVSIQQLGASGLATEVGTPAAGPDVDGEPSQEVEYSAAQEGLDLRLRLVTVFHDGNAYNVTLSALPDDFDAASADLDEILASWAWN
jgi:hypothetical protein